MKQIIILCLSLLFFLSCGKGSYPIGEYKKIIDLSLSPDGNTFFLYYTGKDNRLYYIINGKQTGPLDSVLFYGCTPSGLFYTVCRNGDKFFFDYNGKIKEISAERVVSVDFPPSGDNYLIRAISGTKQSLMSADTVIGPFDSLQESSFSKNGKHTGVVIITSGVYQVLIDGQMHGEYSYAEGIKFSDNGAVWGYSFALAANSAVLVNDRIIDEVSHPSGPYISPDGKAVYYASYGEKKIDILSNKIRVMEIPAGNNTLLIDLYVAGDGSIAGYTLGNPEYFTTMIGGKTYGPFDKWYGKFAMPPDAKDYVFYYENNELGYINLAGKIYGPYAAEGYGKIEFSPDGGNFFAPYFGDNATQWIASADRDYGPFPIIEKFHPSPDYSNCIVVYTDMTSHMIYFDGKDIISNDNICDAVILTNGNIRYAIIEDNSVIIKDWMTADN
ncbi:MAG: hypothetical protein A2014_03925 [Spirochaetes bacterium GWF1_49_6]|nr:MAG: hypothetical protein A2014_03925 [Spirochaetes bacterium GWF1_49_6]